jgi:hypothetical protein
MFRTVSQLVIEYRASALSAGGAGKIRGGDRLPWVRTGTSDNFAPLSAVAWQAHVYGDALGDASHTCSELGIPLHRFSWSVEAARAGLRRGALYLVRPDGYVGFAAATGNGAALRAYCGEWGLRFDRAPAALSLTPLPA